MSVFIETIGRWGIDQNARVGRSVLLFAPVLLLVGIIIVGAAILALQSFGLMPEPKTYTLQNLAGVMILFGSVIASTLVAAKIWAKWLGYQELEFIGLDNERRKLLDGILWGAGLQILFFITLVAFGWLRITSVNLDGHSIINVLIITASSLNIAVFEEVVFRGVAYSVLRRKWSWWKSALITAIPFALYHFIFNQYASPFNAGMSLLAGGILFAWLRETTGNLWTPIGIHFMWDAAIGWFNLSASESPHILMTAINAPGWLVGEWSFSDWMLLFAFAISIWSDFIKNHAKSQELEK